MDKAGKKQVVRKRGKEKPFLPDEIIRNILIKLPVKSLVRFELVCKEWKDMIISRDFVDLHRTSSIPVLILTSDNGYTITKLFAVDKWWDLSRKRTMIHRFPSFASDFPYADIKPFSHSGLIVLKGSRFWNPKPTFLILNPARPRDACVKINYSTDFPGDICAVYYHPTLEEYCVLWRIRIPGSSVHEAPLIQYKVLNLGSDPSIKTISDAFTYRIKDACRCWLIYPLLINNRLYWMLEFESGHNDGHNDILEFDIISQEFMVIPCPIPLSTKCRSCETHMIDSDGNLSFLLILSSTVTIWALRDHELPLWTKTEYINVLAKYHIYNADHIIALVNGMLAYKYQGILCVCNLREGTVKKYPKKYGGGMFLSHQMCLPSLKNCKDGLYIDKDGEVFV